LIWLFQISFDKHKQIRGCLVTARETTIKGFQVTPANGALDVLCAASFLQESPQGLAVKGITRLQFANG